MIKISYFPLILLFIQMTRSIRKDHLYKYTKIQGPFQQYPKRYFPVLFITLTRASVRSNQRNITHFPHIARVRGSVAFKSSSVKEKVRNILKPDHRFPI